MEIIVESPKINISSSYSKNSYNDSVLSISREVIHCKNELNNDSLLLERESWFDLFLTVEEWLQIKPVDIDSKRSNHTLKSCIWTDIIFTAFWKQHRLPCVFKRAEVSTSLNRKYFLKISGRQCSSNKCKNLFYAVTDKEPKKDCDLLIRVKTRNTTFTEHEDIR